MKRLLRRSGLSGRQKVAWGVGFLALAYSLTGCFQFKDRPEASPLDAHVGLDLELVNGKLSALELLEPGAMGQRQFYVQQLRFQAKQTGFPATGALEWLKARSELSTLDWSGLAMVGREWEELSNKTGFRQTESYLLAAWMQSLPSFTVEFLDSTGQRVGEAISLTKDHFVLARGVAMSWADGQQVRGDNGTQLGSYPALQVSSGGVYAGASDEIFSVQVSTEGALGVAQFDVTSVAGLAARRNRVLQGGQPEFLDGSGTGPWIQLEDSAGTAFFAKGDRWLVRCVASTGAVSAPEAGPRATFGAMAEVRLSAASRNTPLFSVPQEASQLKLTWSGDPADAFTAPVSFHAPSFDGQSLDYGFEIELSPSPPANGDYYEPGEELTLSVNLKDGAGHRLHPEGQLPTYQQFLDEASNGILYYRNAGEPSGGGFFAEHRLNMGVSGLLGPKQNMAQSYSTTPPSGVVKLTKNLPDMGVVNGGLKEPARWQTPVPSQLKLSLPLDAQPGTYVAMAKFTRSFLGETLHRAKELDVQVGAAKRTYFPERVGNCDLCHLREAALSRLRHGVGQSGLCSACHLPPHGTAPGLVHRLHFFSSKYPEGKNNCSACHIAAGSNARASMEVCGACHGEVHRDEFPQFIDRPLDACGQTCHERQPTGNGHIPLAPQ